jgi:hypothetical protein
MNIKKEINLIHIYELSDITLWCQIHFHDIESMYFGDLD